MQINFTTPNIYIYAFSYVQMYTYFCASCLIVLVATKFTYIAVHTYKRIDK